MVDFARVDVGSMELLVSDSKEVETIFNGGVAIVEIVATPIETVLLETTENVKNEFKNEKILL